MTLDNLNKLGTRLNLIVMPNGAKYDLWCASVLAEHATKRNGMALATKRTLQEVTDLVISEVLPVNGGYLA